MRSRLNSSDHYILKKVLKEGTYMSLIFVFSIVTEYNVDKYLIYSYYNYCSLFSQSSKAAMKFWEKSYRQIEEKHTYNWKSESVSHSVLSDSLQPNGLQPTRLLCPWDSPGKKSGVGSHSFLQGIFLTQGSTWVSLIAARFITIWATIANH